MKDNLIFMADSVLLSVMLALVYAIIKTNRSGDKEKNKNLSTASIVTLAVWQVINIATRVSTDPVQVGIACFIVGAAAAVLTLRLAKVA